MDVCICLPPDQARDRRYFTEIPRKHGYDEMKSHYAALIGVVVNRPCQALSQLLTGKAVLENIFFNHER